MRLFPVAVTALAVLAGALPSAASAAPTERRVPVGISDQSPATFSAALFGPLGIRYGRYVTPWNVATKPDSDPAKALDAWLEAARTAGVKPLISFEHLTTDDCPRVCTKPSDAAYRKAFRAFRAAYPDVLSISPWNEANHMAQPTYKRPDLAARYYHVVKRECPQCQVVAADVLDLKNMEAWLEAFVEAAPDARLWGMHNYGDANRFRTSGIETYLRTVKGSIWLTETGAITAFTTAAGKVSFKRSDTRAAKAMTYLFDTLVPSSTRIKRVYVYNWGSDPNNRWDTGLVDHKGKPRPVYDIVKRYGADAPADAERRR